MPVHRVPRHDLDTAIVRIEREGGEEIVHVVADGDDYVFITRQRFTLRNTIDIRRASQ